MLDPTDRDLTEIFCPECGEPVEDVAPQNYLVPGLVPVPACE